MRALGVVVCLILGSLSGATAAQSLTDGPLAAPGPAGPAATKARSPKGHRAAAKGIQHAKAAAKAPGALPENPAAPVPVATTKRSTGDTADPLSLGMKWNGNNDNGEKTRVQNYDGNAAGTGAAVGLNYHF